jgi:hypothetical protein
MLPAVRATLGNGDPDRGRAFKQQDQLGALARMIMRLTGSRPPSLADMVLATGKLIWEFAFSYCRY